MILGVAAFAALIAVNVSINSRSEDLSDIALANIEALAGGEGGNYTGCCGNGCSAWYDWDTQAWIGCGGAPPSDFCCYGR